MTRQPLVLLSVKRVLNKDDWTGNVRSWSTDRSDVEGNWDAAVAVVLERELGAVAVAGVASVHDDANVAAKRRELVLGLAPRLWQQCHWERPQVWPEQKSQGARQA